MSGGERVSIRDIRSQERAIGKLQRAYSAGRMAHAYIFAGNSGVGKFATAREFSKMLLCKEPVETEGPGAEVWTDSCGRCESCELFESGGHPDFKHLYKELVEFTKEGKRKVPIDFPKDVVDEFLIDTVLSRPSVSARKIYVLTEGEKLNVSSQNTLLKVLEEPPGYCVIFLVCDDAEVLLDTIHSRCQVVRFGPVDVEFIIDKLGEAGVDGEDEARFWARFSEQSVGEAIFWGTLKTEDFDLYEIKREVVSRLAGYGAGESLDFADELVKQSKVVGDALVKKYESLSSKDLARRADKVLIRFIMSALRDAMKVAVDGGAEIINAEQRGEIEKIAPKYDIDRLGEMIDEAAVSVRWVDSSVNQKLNFEKLLLNAAGCGIV